MTVASFGLGKLLHVFRPERHGDAQQQHGFDEHDGEFGVFGNMAFGAFVVGVRVARGVETPEDVAKINDPADEQREHQPVDINHEVVHGLAVGGGEFGQAENVMGKPVVHTFEASGGDFFRAAASSASLLRMT